MFYKILICQSQKDLQRLTLDELNPNKIFATKYENCGYSVVGFARNFFSSIICTCQFINKNVAGFHCRQPAHLLNFSVWSLCWSGWFAKRF